MRMVGRVQGRCKGAPWPVSAGGTARLVRALLPLAVISALVTAGCGGGGELRISNPEGGTTIELDFPPGEEWKRPLPTISGGFRPYEASLEGCPDWVRLLFPDQRFPARRILAGIAPADARGQHLCTYRVTEADPGFRPQRSVTYVLRLVVDPGSASAVKLSSLPKIDLAVGTWHSEALPDASGGIEPYTYSFTCAGGQLPSGMGFAPETRMFAGTPDARFRDSCTYTVTDSSEPATTVSRAVEVEVTSAATPRLTLPEDVVESGGLDNRISLHVQRRYSIEFKQASGGVQPYTYDLQCDLPGGLGFSPDTRILSGTPAETYRGPDCTYTVTDSSEPATTVSRAVEVEVTSAATPRLTLPEDVVESGGLDNRISLHVQRRYSIEFKQASGGVQPYTYDLQCDLPGGLGFSPDTRILSGTPAETYRGPDCTYTVTDSSEPATTVSRAVEVEVTSAATPRLTLPEDVVESGGLDNRISLHVQRRYSIEFKQASGGVQPYTYDLQCDLPGGLGFSPDTRILSGTPAETYRGPDCTYRVTDSGSPPESAAQSVVLIVDSLDQGTWRFRTRSLPQSEHPVSPEESDPQVFVELPHAIDGTGTETYELLDIRPPLTFDASARALSYTHPPVPPLFNTSTTFRYQVSVGDATHDALCIDVAYLDLKPRSNEDGLADTVRVSVRDDAYWNGNEYRCPDAPPGSASSSRAAPSNPVHTALAPVHARRAVDVAHSAVRDRVRGWSPGDPRALSAITPEIGLASLSGRSGGFEYSGSSESLSAGAELGTGSWQAGMVASYTGTDLHYRAGANLAEHGYRAGEHDTEILSLHPFAAWHASSGGHLWASLGAGTGGLRHRDDLGFPSWSRSDVRLLSYAAGASVPVADVLSGELEAEAGIEAFALEIEGGGRISSSLPTLRGRDYRAGLAWSAPLPGAPSVSMAYRHLTGDGPEGGSLEARGSASVAGFLHPRLSLTGSAEASFGLGDHDRDLRGLGAGLRFAPDGLRRGFGLGLDARLVSDADERSSGVSIRGEAGYGLWGGPFFGTVRPYVGVIRYSGGGRSVQQTLGIDLREAPNSTVKVEFHGRFGDRPRAIMFTLWHRL